MTSSVTLGVALIAGVAATLAWTQHRNPHHFSSSSKERLLLNGLLCIGVLGIGSILVDARRLLIERVLPLSWEPLIEPLRQHPWIYWTLCILSLDLAGYTAHRVAHSHSLFWRFHRVHHSDPGVSLSTAFRHHPIEVVWNFAFHSSAVFLWAMPLEVRGIFVTLATCHNQWSHANIQTPQSWERWISVMLVTPRSHRLHHSKDFVESSHNFGAIFSIWDRLLGTYLPGTFQPVEFGIDENPPSALKEEASRLSA